MACSLHLLSLLSLLCTLPCHTCRRNPSSPGAEEVKLAGDYSQLLASSIFCLVLPGDGWSARMDDATLHG